MYNFLEVLELAIKILEQELYNWYAEEEDKIEVMSTEFIPFRDDVEVLAQRISIDTQIKYIEHGLNSGKDVYEQKRHLENILKRLEEYKDNPLVKRYEELSAQWTGIFSLESASDDSSWHCPPELSREYLKKEVYEKNIYRQSKEAMNKEEEITIDNPIKLENGEELIREELNHYISHLMPMLKKEKPTKRGVTKSPLVKGKAKKNLRKLNKARRKQK